MKFFDYIFYRIYLFYKGQDDSILHIYSSGLITVLQFFSLLAIAAIVTSPFDLDPINKYFSLIIVIPLMLYNWNRYERNFDIEEYKEKYGNESLEDRKRKGRLIVVWFVLVILIPVIIGVLRNNYGLF